MQVLVFLSQPADQGDISNYHPGKDFLIAAQKLADSKDFQSLASKINRFIENEVSLPIAQKKFDDKYKK